VVLGNLQHHFEIAAGPTVRLSFPKIISARYYNETRRHRNKIEHRLFSFITQNWRGKPLVSLKTIVQLIAATTTNTGLKVRCAIDPKTYPAGVKVTNREMAAIDILRHTFHGDWNYTIRPKTPVPKR
jgi:hypothetical protein